MMSKKWTLYSLIIITAFLIILLLKLKLLPNFLDIYYHLSAASGFNRAGGFVTHDFWEYAPSGRPNLYPPLFHFLILGLIKSGLPLIFIARVLDAVIFPLFLFTIWFFVRSLFNERLAFFSVIICASLYSFYLCASNFIPVTLAFAFGLFSFWAMEKKKILSASIFLGLAFYAHAQVPWVFVLAFLIYGFLARHKLIASLKVIAFGILLALPLIIYLLKNIRFYNPQSVYENFVLEINLYLILSIFGLKKVFLQKDRYYFLFALVLAAIPFAPAYPYRYISGQGLVGIILLSAIGLEGFYDSARNFFLRKALYRIDILLILAVVFFVLFSPSIIITRDKQLKFLASNSAYVNIISSKKQVERPNERSLYSRFIPEIIKIIQENSEKNDIIFTNIPLSSTMISVLSDRMNSQGMLREVVPRARDDAISNAGVIVWFKISQEASDTELNDAVRKYGLKKIGETDIAYIYKNNFTDSRAHIAKPLVSNKIILIICVCTLVLLILDLKSLAACSRS